RAKGIQGVLAGLEADGLVTLTRPLRGNADASRTIRVAMLTAQGNEAVDEEVARLGARQQQALALLVGAPDGLTIATIARSDSPSESFSLLALLGLVTIERRRVE